MNVVCTSTSVSFMHGKCICFVKFAIVFDDASSLLYCFTSNFYFTRDTDKVHKWRRSSYHSHATPCLGFLVRY